MTRLFLRLPLALGALLAGVAFLHRATASMPTSFSPTDPTLLVLTLLRSAALVAGAYLAAAAGLGAMARLGHVRPLVRALDRITVPALRRLLDASLGASVLATVTVSPSAWADPPPVDGTSPPITMLRLPDAAPDPLPPPHAAPPEPVSSTTSSAVAPDTTLAPPEPVASTTTTVAVPPTTSTIAMTSTSLATTATTPPSPSSPSSLPPPVSRRSARLETPPSEAVQAGEQWTVQPGEHLWAIAQQVLARSWGREPSDAEADPYWRSLVEANRDRLADRDNPDLVFAGQVFALPPAPLAPP